MGVSPSDFEERLESISEYNGVPFGRIDILLDAEAKYESECGKYSGYQTLSDGFKHLFLETVELINSDLRPKIKVPLPTFFPFFLSRLIHSFQTLCGSERVALCGYPLHGYTLLRNAFDNLILTSAVLQNVTDYYSIEGIEPGKAFDPIAAKKLRKQTEFKVRDVMTGAKSGLSQHTLEELAKWDALFDYETHGARLTLASSMEWLKGAQPLPVVPQFVERDFAMFINRYCEIGWMTHRLLPLIQPQDVSMSDAWKTKWGVVDNSFETAVYSLTEQLGKGIGAAIVELVKAKFPFNEHSHFPP